jgi:hypothetical protein
LRQKYSEMRSDSDNLLISTIMQDAPKSIQAVSEKGLSDERVTYMHYSDFIVKLQLNRRSKVDRIGQKPARLFQDKQASGEALQDKRLAQVPEASVRSVCAQVQVD